MAKVQAVTTCRVCGAARDPKCRMALCAGCAKARRKVKNAQHGASGKPRSERIADCYDRLNVRGLLAARRA